MSRLEAEKHEEIYRIYITDCISGYLGVKLRYADLVDDTPRKPEPSAEEAIAGIKSKLGGSQENESI